MRSKKILCLIMTAMLATASLTACSKPASSDKPAKEGDVTKIRFTDWDGGAAMKVFEKIADKFNAQSDDIEVTFMNIPDEYDTKITTMVAGNDAPEVASMESGTLLFPYAEEGKVLNINDFIAKDTEFDESNLLDEFKYNLNEEYLAGYGMGAENICMFYSPELFEKHNIEAPPAKYSDAWDWDTFVDTAKKLTFDKNGNNALSPDFNPDKIDVYGVNFGRWWATYMPLILSNGGDYLNEDGTEIGYLSPEAADALQKMADLIYVHHVAPTPTAGESMPGLSEAIATNKVAMTFEGQWTNNSLMSDGIKYDVAALPKIGAEAKTIKTFGSISIMDTPKADAAWEFFKFMLEPGSCEDLYTSAQWLPSTAAEYTEEYLKSIITDKHPKNYYDSIITPMLDGTAAPPLTSYVKNFNKINDVITPALDEVWSGDKTVEEALAAVKDDANAEVKGFLGK